MSPFFLLVLATVKIVKCSSHHQVPKSPRLFSNPFGLLGRDQCVAKLEGFNNATGFCSNEMECLLKGGLFGGYCGPPAVKGVCCVYANSDCSRRMTEKVSYFTNKSFPKNDVEVFHCLLSIKALPDTCWIKFDFHVLDLDERGLCAYNSMAFLNRPDGPSGNLCGNKSGYSTLIAPSKTKDLNLAVRLQGPSYRWNIKITQIACDQIATFNSGDNCGIANVDAKPDFQFNALRVNATTIEARKPKICTAHGKCYRKRLKRKPRGATEDKTLLLLQKSLWSSKFKLSSKRNDDAVLNKIINGKEAGVNKYPWMVSMQLRGSHFCGASLISESWILTAAHCVDVAEIKNFIPRVILSLGDHDLTTTDETPSITRTIQQIFVHPGWEKTAFSGDFALLQVDQPVPFSATISPICLPGLNEKSTFASEVATLAGWGVTEAGELSTYLREVENFVIDNITCYEAWSDANKIDESMLCTLKGPLGTESGCNGDSGGPLAFLRDGRYLQIGLVSYGDFDCNSETPSVFARITYAIEWINAVVSSADL